MKFIRNIQEKSFFLFYFTDEPRFIGTLFFILFSALALVYGLRESNPTFLVCFIPGVCWFAFPYVFSDSMYFSRGKFYTNRHKSQYEARRAYLKHKFDFGLVYQEGNDIYHWNGHGTGIYKDYVCVINIDPEQRLMFVTYTDPNKKEIRSEQIALTASLW